MSVQITELSEVAKLRWDGTTKLVRAEVPERAKSSDMITQYD